MILLIIVSDNKMIIIMVILQQKIKNKNINEFIKNILLMINRF